MVAPNPPLLHPNQPLPPNTFHSVNEAPLHDAYGYCLENKSQIEAGNTTTLAHACCLGYLL